MNVILLYLILLKATVTAFSGLASLSVVQDSLVDQYHVLTLDQLNQAVVITRSTPGPVGLYIVSVGYFAGGVAGAIAGWLAMITPALSVLSAVEGLEVITPTFARFVVPLSVLILFGLFAVQSRGTARVASFFGPVTLVWFIVLAIGGAWHVAQNLSVLAAFNPLHGVTNHPMNLDFSPGGSSGGPAAALATGMSALELASDLGGSIRWPAHCCGLYGLKTSWGLATSYGHTPPPANKRTERDPDCLVVGPMARAAADLKLMLEIIAGPRHAARPTPLRPSRASLDWL